MVWPFDALEDRVSKLELRLVNAESRLGDVQLSKLQKTMEALMSKVSDFAEAAKGYISSVVQSLSELNVSLTGLTGDITDMKALIEKLQASSEISEEDQKTLDELTELVKGASTTATEAAAKAKELDDRTPPSSPPA